MQFLDIGEVAAQSGLRPSALRYYEAAGLIASAGRQGLRRQLPANVVLPVKLIAMGKAAGFSLEEIGRMFGGNVLPDLPRDMIRTKADEIDRHIHELMALRDTLRHVADWECPTFERLVAVGGKRGGKQGRAGKPARSRR